MKVETFRRHFLGQVADLTTVGQLLDLLPDVAFFLKDRQGRFVMLNRRGIDDCGVATEHEAIGRRDHDFFPKERADLYVASDRQVIRSGVPILNAIDPAPEGTGSDKLIVYSKVPVRNRQGRIIGVAGIYRELEGLRFAPPTYHRLAQVVRHLQTRYADRWTTPQLARMVGLSSSQFDRQFRRLFNTTVRQYLLRIRVQAASRLLAQSDQAVTEVALATGFYDHAHLTRTFSRLLGMAPLAYRKQHRPA